MNKFSLKTKLNIPTRLVGFFSSKVVIKSPNFLKVKII